MEALTRYPSVSKFYFLECSGNGLTDWLKAASTTVQQTHGLLSCAQWTGIPVSWLLDEAGLAPGRKWIAFEGADGSGHTRSLPLKKVLDDCLIVYAQNGEMLRAEQGYPVRLLVPGWEGNVSVKWLRRIKVGDAAVAFPQRNRALHGPDAGRKVAPVQLRDGMQVGRHASFRRHVDQAGHARDRGLRLVRQRQDSRGRRDARRRHDVARGEAGGAGARQVPDAFPTSRGTGRAGRRRLPAAPWTAPATCSRPCRKSRRCERSSASSSITTAFSRGRSARAGRSRMRSLSLGCRLERGDHRRRVRNAAGRDNGGDAEPRRQVWQADQQRRYRAVGHRHSHDRRQGLAGRSRHGG